MRSFETTAIAYEAKEFDPVPSVGSLLACRNRIIQNQQKTTKRAVTTSVYGRKGSCAFFSFGHCLGLIQVCTFHDGCKQGIDQQIFNRKSISRKITHPQSLFK